jgi:hypothetical protein
MICSAKPVLTEDLCIVQKQEFFSNMLYVRVGVRTFVPLALRGVLASGHWSFYGERWFGNACVGVQATRLWAVGYKYRLF